MRDRWHYIWTVPTDTAATRTVALLAEARRRAVADAAAHQLRPGSWPHVYETTSDDDGCVDVHVTFDTQPVTVRPAHHRPVRNLMPRRTSRPVIREEVPA